MPIDPRTYILSPPKLHGPSRYVLRMRPWLAARAVLGGACMTWGLLIAYGVSPFLCALYGAVFAVAVLLEL